jgi:VanZ family protein
MASFKVIISRWGPALIIMGVIFIASSIPSGKMPSAGSWDMLVKKGGHMLGYALLGLSFMRAQNCFKWQAMILAVVGCLFYALSDEWHQSFVGGRNMSLVDVGIDFLGTIVGLGLVIFSRRVRRMVFAFR